MAPPIILDKRSIKSTANALCAQMFFPAIRRISVNTMDMTAAKKTA